MALTFNEGREIESQFAGKPRSDVMSAKFGSKIDAKCQKCYERRPETWVFFPGVVQGWWFDDRERRLSKDNTRAAGNVR